MKKINFVLAMGITLTLASCAELQKMTSSSSSGTESVYKIDAPKFTTVDKVLKLSEGMSYQEVVSALGCEPYDIYSLNDKENKTVLIWHYKKIKRNEDPNVMKKREGATTGGEVICCEEVAYLTFDGKKLVSLVTDAGKGSSESADKNADSNQVPKQEEKKGIMKFF